jgi:uncharacterized membrane protein
MKKFVCLLLLVSACAETKIINGVHYDTYGLFNEAEKRNPDITYQVVPGNIVWGLLLVETIAAPIYFFGFSLYEPKGQKSSHIKGSI